MTKTMDKRQEILMKISVLINELKETDIYALQSANKVDLTGPLQDTENVIDFLICRLEKQE